MVEVNVQIDSNVAELAERYSRVAPKIMRRYALRAGEHVAGEIRRQIAAWTSKTASVKTGALARSFRPTFMDRDGELGVIVSSDLPYAAIHETGGTIAIRGPNHWAAIFASMRRNGLSIQSRSRPNVRTGKNYITIRPKRYISLAAQASISAVNQILSDGVREITDQMAAGGRVG